MTQADTVGGLTDDDQVMGDQQDRHSATSLDILGECQDLGLDRQIENGRRFVGHQWIRFNGERHRDHHPLALTTGQFVRILGQSGSRFADPDFPEQLDDLSPHRLFGDLRVGADDLGHLITDPVDWVEPDVDVVAGDGDDQTEGIDRNTDEQGIAARIRCAMKTRRPNSFRLVPSLVGSGSRAGFCWPRQASGPQVRMVRSAHPFNTSGI